jgi:hypothetical protein
MSRSVSRAIVGGRNVSVEVQDVTLGDVLRKIAQLSKTKVIIDPCAVVIEPDPDAGK